MLGRERMFEVTRTIPIEVQSRYLPKVKKQRIWELDFLRGACVILMVLDHLALLIEYFSYSWYGGGWYAYGLGGGISRFCYWWSYSTDRDIAHNIVLVVFFAISGISCSFSRSNLKRGTQLLAVAYLYSLVTVFDEYVLGITGEMVVFGVLHFLAFSILIYALVERLCKRDRRSIAICSVGIMGIVLILYFCYTPPKDTPIIFAAIFPPVDFWGNKTFYVQSEFSPGDLFPMIPYLAHFFLGGLLAPILYPTRRSLLKPLDGVWNKPLCFVGRHALIVYLIHILLSAGILALVSFLFITPGSFGF